MNIFDSIGRTFNTVTLGIEHSIHDAFDPTNHGFLDGNFDDFALGFKRATGLVPQAISQGIETVSQGVGRAENNLLSPINNSPAFYIMAGGGIIALVIFGYVAFKVLKYV